MRAADVPVKVLGLHIERNGGVRLSGFA